MPVGGVKCKRCSGEGKYTDYEATCFAAYFKRCERCGGTGYVEEGAVGETISYSSGKVSDVDSLVEEAREANRRAVYHAEYGLSIFEGFDHWRDFYAKHANDLCGALEERQAEVERLRGVLRNQQGMLELWQETMGWPTWMQKSIEAIEIATGDNHRGG